MPHQGLCTLPEMTHISQADTVNSGWMLALQDPHGKSGNVYQDISLSTGGTFIFNHMLIMPAMGRYCNRENHSINRQPDKVYEKLKCHKNVTLVSSECHIVTIFL